MRTRLRPLPARFGSLALAALVCVLGAASLQACATYTDDLQRGVDYYKNNEHERSLAMFRALEPDVDSLKPNDRARYYFYRGMTDYRLISDKYDISADARHWLGLAKAAEEETPSSLTEKEMGYLKEALDELNAKVYGTDAEAESPKKKDDEGGKKKKGDKDKEKDEDDEKAAKKEDKPAKKKKKSSDD